jgi:hypothetical protein
MDTAFVVSGDPDRLIPELFPLDERGRCLFGFSGRSRMPCDRHQLFEGFVEFIGYLMEGFVPYLVAVDRVEGGLRIIVRKTGTNRDRYVDSFVMHYLSATGHAVTKEPA